MEVENLIRLIEAVSNSSLTGFKYKADGVYLNLKKEKDSVPVVAAAPLVQTAATPFVQNVVEPVNTPAAAPEISAPEPEKPAGNLVKSPLVGTFYAAPAEDAAPFVAVGDKVSKGQVLAIVEAMKLMNDIESEFDGTVEEILVTNGETVEYGQPLFRIV